VIVAVCPASPTKELDEGLNLIAERVERLNHLEVAEPALQDAHVLVVELADHPMRLIREAARLKEDLGVPILLVVEPDHIALLDSASFDDFQVGSGDPVELRLRLNRLVHEDRVDEVLHFKDLMLNTLTYQATLGGTPMDLTYMEYELLKFLVQNPVRVWSREQLLSKVWGYDYYGGARTVDVHIRRLRSKLGEERSSWIDTVRSVGYRFG
jgi:DNA-binding response OmpR family regulator